MYNIHDEDGEYVCITHQCVIPCEEGEYHLVSNWAADVNRIRKIIERNMDV